MDTDGYSMLFAGLGIFAIVVFLLIFLICIAAIVVLLIGKWKLFKKAGKEGWEAIIPFYGDYVLVEIADLNWYWFIALDATSFLAIITLVIPALSVLNFLAYIAVILASLCVWFNLSKKLHKDTAWIVLGTIFSGVMAAIAGFDKKITYDKDVKVTKNGIFDKDK